MKKIIALILACLLVCSASALVFADDKADTTAKMLSVVKSRIDSTDKYDKFSNSSRTENGKTVYSFHWYTDGGEELYSRYSSLDVDINDEGIITSYNKYSSDKYTFENTPRISSQSSQKAEETAEKWIKKLNPDIADELILKKEDTKESLYQSGYSFNVQRYEDGIPVLGNDGYIVLSQDAEDITSFYITYNPEIEFKKADSLINREEAVKKFDEKIGMRLHYAAKYDKLSVKAELEYCPESSHGKYISAVDGELVEKAPNLVSERGVVAAEDTASAKSESFGSNGGGFSDVEISELDKISGLVLVSELEKSIRSNPIINISDKYKLENYRLSKKYNTEKYIYYLEFNYNEGENYEWADISADAQNGTIISFYKSNSMDYGSEKSSKKLSEESVLKKVQNAVETLAPEHFGKNGDNAFRMNEYDDYTDGYFSYTRYVNEIPYDANGVSISADMTDGSIYRYSIDIDDIEFPSAEGILSASEACKSLFEQIDYNVYYLPVQNEDKSYTADPVYVCEGRSMDLDAFTGKLKYGHNEEKVGGYDDISGHYAEKAITTLAKYNIGFSGDKFMPDKNITQAEFISLINMVFFRAQPVLFGENYDYSYAYRSAASRGILSEEEYSPQSEVTRESAAVMLIRAMNYEEVAKLSGIYTQKFNDVTDNIGYTAILSAMGILNGDGNGNFNPSVKLTRAAAEVMLYNYLSR